MPRKPTAENPTPRAQLAQWIRAEIDGKSSVELPQLADAALEMFAADQQFVRDFMAEMMRPMVYEIARQVMKSTRPKGDVIELGDTLMSRDDFKAQSKKAAARWRTWLEHAGTKHIRLMEMTRTDLTAAADERRKRGDAEYELANLWDALAERLEGNERVSERFTADEIERVRMALANTEAKAA